MSLEQSNSNGLGEGWTAEHTGLSPQITSLTVDPRFIPELAGDFKASLGDSTVVLHSTVSLGKLLVSNQYPVMHIICFPLYCLCVGVAVCGSVDAAV